MTRRSHSQQRATRSPQRRTQRPWRGLAIWFGAFLAVALVLYATRTPILQWIGRELVRADAMESSDAIIVLSGGEGDRELEAADLFAAHAAPLIVLTTERDSAALPELLRRKVKVERAVERQRRYLKELGVPESAIVVLEDQAKSTVEEASIVAAWIKTRQIRQVIIVSSSFHTRRAGYIFEWMLRGTGVVVRMRPAAQDRYKPDTWWTDRNTLLAGLVEWQKTIYYRLRYW
ncbi:MAG: YdcF family protein [Acidobacteria bacterium]|nr:YdcF family protein [Acidobacteriota bacterium]